MCTISDELFELMDPLLRSIALRIAGSDLFNGEEWSDLLNELWVITLPGLKTYSASRGQAERFVVVVAGSAKRTLQRRRRTLRHKFEIRVQSLHDHVEFDDAESAELHETIVHEPSERRRIAEDTINGAMDGAPDHLWEAFHSLEEGSQRKASNRARMDRRKMHHCVEALRQRFDATSKEACKDIPATSNGHRVVNE